MIFAHEQKRWFWHGKMHAGVLDRTECADSTCQLAFQRTLVVHLLAELADAKLFFVQQFKADSTTFRQPL